MPASRLRFGSRFICTVLAVSYYLTSSTLMATAAKRAVLQTAFTSLSVRGLRRRRLGHIGPNHLSNQVDKWGRKNTNGNGVPSNLLAAGGSRRPVPRASLVLGGQRQHEHQQQGGGRLGNRAIATNGNGLANNNNNGAGAAAKHQLINGSGTNNNGGANGNGVNNGNRLLEQQRGSQSMAINSRKYMNGTASLTNGYLNGLSDTNNVNGNHSNATSTSGNHQQQQQQSKDKPTTSSSGDNGSSNSSSDLIVVLDMDECLIHSQFLSDQMVDKYRQYEERPSSNSPFGNNEEAIMWQTTCDSFRIHLPDGDLVNVNKRPNLDLFLREITGRFETYIFTAAMEVYAAPVLNKLDPTGEMFRGRFYREHCVYDPDLGVYAKDLCEVLRQRPKMMINADDGNTANATAEHDHEECIPCDERRVVLVDNNPLSFIPNPSNGILVSSFYDDPKDDTLEAVMELLHELDKSEDVRPILEGKFGLKDALDDVVQGGPVGW